MYLRNVLLFVSVVLVGLLISLYFQSGQEVQTVNWDQYKTATTSDERSLSLEDLNRKLEPLSLEEIIREIWEKNRLAGEKTRIMEIGIRNGQLLMTLKKKFPEIEFYGINRNKSHDFYRRESFIQTALRYDIMTQSELENIDLPYVVFQDLDFGQDIPYDDNKFDLIFSQDVLRLIKYKFELLSEIMRILKPSGISIHTDVSNIPIYSRGVLMEMKDAFKEMRKHHFNISYSEENRILRFKKEGEIIKFPFTPHQEIPEIINDLEGFRRSEMGYNINY